MGFEGVKNKKQTQFEVALKDISDAKAAVRMGMVDTVATYINKGYYLQFSRVADSDFSANFFALMESFQDSYSSNFQQESVFGRTDPIPYYQNTQRSISMSWTLVAHNSEAASNNLNDVNTLAQMLYPSYTRHGSQRTFSGAPVVSIKYINLIQERGGKSLAGTISSFTHTPDLEFGVFEEQGAVLPKVIRLTCTFNPLHEETIGFKQDGDVLTHSQLAFPYDNKWTVRDKNGNVTETNFPLPGSPSQVEFDQEYFKGFKDSEDGKIDKAYSDVLQKRAKEILERRYGTPGGFWNKPFFNR